jgi:hypothetical protein
MNNYLSNNAFENLQEALENLYKVRGTIFDMRKPANSKYINLIPLGLFLDWTNSYFKGTILSPSYRNVSYVGLPGIMGEKYGGYEPYYKQSMGFNAQAMQKKKFQWFL